jgi:pimeloyl-ACP methyl ester carboxylesterase
MWKAYVRDFVVSVIKEPVVVAGNSIGGVIPANACADHPHIFKGLVLINTAGSTDIDYDPEAPRERKQQSKLFVNVTSWFVFNFLQRNISKQLQRLYPARPFNADPFLSNEIYRASCDPCALQVSTSSSSLTCTVAWPLFQNVHEEQESHLPSHVENQKPFPFV